MDERKLEGCGAKAIETLGRLLALAIFVLIALPVAFLVVFSWGAGLLRKKLSGHEQAKPTRSGDKNGG